MSRKIGVLDLHQPVGAKPCRYIKKAVAALLLRRLLAVKIDSHLIQMVAVKSGRTGDAPVRAQTARCRPHRYEHHIEPRIEHLTPANSEWMAYLEGYGHFA